MVRCVNMALLRIPDFTNMWEFHPALTLGILLAATLLPVVALVLSIRFAFGGHERRRAYAIGLLSVCIASVYLHPLTQERLAETFLTPKLERARALFGFHSSQLILEIGPPDGRRSNYLIYHAPWWTPLAVTDLGVPLAADGEHVAAFARLSD